MIIRKLRVIRIQLTLGLLLALSGVFICNALCDLSILDIRMYSGQNKAVDLHSQGSNHGHDHLGDDGDHHDDLHSKTLHQDKHNHSNHQHGDKEECCEEETSRLLASLVNSELPSFQMEKVPVLLQVVALAQEFTSFTSNKKHNVYSLNSSLSPPLSGYDVRILYQSFLC
ncbi:MAG: hypothetical protein RIA62_18380 [Cyclobacteriaceae bacterium]